MSGSHVARSAPKQKSNSAWKVWVLVGVLIIVLAALAFLLWQMFGAEITGSLGLGSGGGTADIAPGIFTQVGAADQNSRNVAGNIAVTQGSQRPDDVDPEEELLLLDIAWTGKKELNEPLYLTVSDPSFTDGDGLAVHHYNSTAGAWELIGTYVIAEQSVTFKVDSLSPFAFQVLSAEPEPVITPVPEITPEPTATPEPTPTPTPAPLAAVDYGMYSEVQAGAYALAEKMEDHTPYVVALIPALPGVEAEQPEETAEPESSGGVDFTYVEANEAAPAPVEEAAPAVETYIATVLFNVDGEQLSAVNMPLVQTDNGVWCLAGPVTAGMLWESYSENFQGEIRYSLKNNDRYLNLDDSSANVILNDNKGPTRWLLETAEQENGTTINTITYRNPDRYYVSALGMVGQTLVPAGGSQATYLGGELAGDGSVVSSVLQFTVTSEEKSAMQVVLFKQDGSIQLPATNAVSSRISVSEIDETVNLSALTVKDGDQVLQMGTDYIVSAQVYNETVVVVIHFIGNYTGQIVRTYAGTSFRTSENDPIPTPEPTATPAPVYTGGYTGGGSTGGGSTGGGYTGFEDGGNSSASTSDATVVDASDSDA